MNEPVPTEEQAEIIAGVRAGDSFTVKALAGTGKTTTIAMAVGALPHTQRVLYTAYNRRIVEDAKGRFHPRTSIRTNHSLAWGIGSRFKDAGKLERRLNVLALVEALGWTRDTFSGIVDASTGCALAIQTVNRFCGSASDQLLRGHVPTPASFAVLSADQQSEVRQRVVQAARLLWNRMQDLRDPTIPATHDTYFKLFCLSKPRLKFDTIVYDEAQDASGAMISLLAEQTHAQQMCVGDDHQSVYAWRGAVSAMNCFAARKVLTLTQSFRFGPAIAHIANDVLDRLSGSSLRLRGSDAIRSVVSPCAKPRALLARTNATLVSEVVSGMQQFGLRLAVVGGVSEAIRLVEGVHDLQQGLAPRSPDLFGLSTFGELVEFAQTPAGAEFQRLVDMVTRHGCRPLIGALEAVSGNDTDENSADLILSTAHRSKGREFSSVRLLDDFPIPDATEAGGLRLEGEEANLLYVALTRARNILDISYCPAAQCLRPSPHASSGAAVMAPPPTPRSQNRLPPHWALDTRRLPPAAQDRIATMCASDRIDITDAIGRLLTT